MALEIYEIFPAIFGALSIQHLDSAEPDGFPEEMMISGAGSVDPLMYSTAKSEPKFSLASRDLLAILTGCSLTSGLSATGKFQYRQQESGSDYVSGSNHRTVTCPAGFLYIEDFGAKQGDKEGADIKLKYVPLYDGATAPCTFNASQALTSSVAITASHSMGPVNFENQSGGLGGVQSTRVKPGLATESIMGDGGLWPTKCRIKERRPMFEIEGHNMTVAGTLGLNQLYPITNGITMYYIKNEPGAGRYGIASTVHIAVTATAGAYKLTGISGGKGTSVITKISVLPTSISVNYASAISLPA
jgi:hypothetical protein